MKQPQINTWAILGTDVLFGLAAWICTLAILTSPWPNIAPATTLLALPPEALLVHIFLWTDLASRESWRRRRSSPRVLPRILADTDSNAGPESSDQIVFAGIVASLRRDSRNDPVLSQPFPIPDELSARTTAQIPPGWLMYSAIGLGMIDLFLTAVNFLMTIVGQTAFDPAMLVMALVCGVAAILMCCFTVTTRKETPRPTSIWLWLFSVGWVVLTLEFLLLSNW